MRSHINTVAIALAAIVATVALMLATRSDNHAPLGSFASHSYSAPSTSSSSTGHKQWPRCDFDGNPNNDKPGDCPPWHGRQK